MWILSGFFFILFLLVDVGVGAAVTVAGFLCRREGGSGWTADGVSRLQQLSEQLVDLANENGGRDNITVTLARVLGSFADRKGFVGRLRKMLG